MRAKFGRGPSRKIFNNIDNPLNRPGVGQIFLRREYLSAHACQIWARSDGRVEKSLLNL